MRSRSLIVIIGLAGLFGTELTNHHPGGFDYATSDGADPDIQAIASVTLPLPGGNVECSSCHDVHDYDGISAPFLRATNAGSALCTTCHLK